MKWNEQKQEGRILKQAPRFSQHFALSSGFNQHFASQHYALLSGSNSTSRHHPDLTSISLYLVVVVCLELGGLLAGLSL